MAKPELGTKRICPVTGRKFYDLNKDPIVSPFTGESYPRSYFEPAARGASRAEPRAVAEEADGEETEAEVISLEEADEETAGTAKVVADDVDVDDDLEAGDDDAFLEEDEDDGDDVSDLIGEGLEDDEEA
ncbi:TIGR02300 family protein [Xanthobacter autotrophicus DSM 431]|uniref:TIGR02300 family protein n=1 Tax=Xanthobacter nonsaccharivorans TaxID=3119912 RepID=UPI00372C2429